MLLLLPCNVEKHKLASTGTAWRQSATRLQQCWPQQELQNQPETLHLGRTQATLALLQWGDGPEQQQSWPGCCCCPEQRVGRPWPVSLCCPTHTSAFPFPWSRGKRDPVTKIVLFAVLERGIPWALLPLCPVLSMECLSRENMGGSVYIFDFHAEAPKLGQWPDNSSFLPASCEAVASLYPSWQRRWDGEENCPKSSKVSL